MSRAAQITPTVYAVLLRSAGMTREELANEIGVAVETISRATSTLADAGAITAPGLGGGRRRLYRARVPARPWSEVTLGELVECGVLRPEQAVLFAVLVEGGE